jgi:hypothetical protein
LKRKLCWIYCVSLNNTLINRRTFFVCSDAPRVTIDDENKTMTSGEDITIDCLIDANQVQWYHNYNVINVEDERFEGGNSEIVSLAISPIVPGDAGNYYCLAENEVGQAVSSNSFYMEVLCE